jgi:hypothetical protein
VAVPFQAPESCVVEATVVPFARKSATIRPSVELLACDAPAHTEGPTSKVIVYTTPDVFAAKPVDNVISLLL